MRRVLIACLSFACACTCGLPASSEDGGAAQDSGFSEDAGAVDSGALDGGTSTDAGISDAGQSDAGSTDAGGLTQWFPGHYVLLTASGPSNQLDQERGRVLDAGFIAPFVGIQVEYDWWLSEGTEGDYTATFAALDRDLAAVHAAGKKLVVFFQYKNFAGAVAVPGYLRDAGPWCEPLPDGGDECGQFSMGNGETAMIWQGQGTGGTADRLQAWVQAAGAHAMSNPYAADVAGVVFPESACSNCETDPAYTPDLYLTGMERDVSAAGAAFPGVPVFQYLNFLPPPSTQVGYLEKFAGWAQGHPFAGVGCPDVAPVPYPGGLPDAGCRPFDPPGYQVLRDAGVQGVVPFNVAIETPDYDICRTPTLRDSYDTAVKPASAGGLRAQYVVWADLENKGANDAFSLPEVAAFVADAGPFPNTAPPTY